MKVTAAEAVRRFEMEGADAFEEILIPNAMTSPVPVPQYEPVWAPVYEAYLSDDVAVFVLGEEVNWSCPSDQEVEVCGGLIRES